MRSDGRSLVIRFVLFGLLTAYSLVSTMSYFQIKSEDIPGAHAKGEPHLSDDKLPGHTPPKPLPSPCASKPSPEEVKECETALKCSGLQPGGSEGCPSSHPLGHKGPFSSQLGHKGPFSSQRPPAPGSVHIQQSNQNKAITHGNVSEDKPTAKQHPAHKRPPGPQHRHQEPQLECGDKQSPVSVQNCEKSVESTKISK